MLSARVGSLSPSSPPPEREQIHARTRRSAGSRKVCASGSDSTHHRVAKSSRKSHQDRGPEQELSHVLRDTRENLLRQKVHDVAVASFERFDKGVLVLPLLQGERSEVDRRRPALGLLEQKPEVIGGDFKPQPLVQQVGGFLLR